MTKADQKLSKNLILTINSKYNDVGQKIRPVWEDGSPAYTQKVFGVLDSYDLREEFPLTTLRPTAWKSGLKETLWIYSDKSNDVDLLEAKYGVKYWREWANDEGNLGLAYGRQMQNEHQYKEGYFDQIDRLIFDLKNNPYSRRMITNLYNHQDLHGMTLYPCAFLTMWDYDGEKLNMTLVQRSSDYLAAGMINVSQYALLMHMVAQSVGMQVGVLNHYINNLHIYDQHIDIAKELIKRTPISNKPKLIIDDSIKNFYDFKPEHFDVEDYSPHTNIKIPIAI